MRHSQYISIALLFLTSVLVGCGKNEKSANATPPAAAPATSSSNNPAPSPSGSAQASPAASSPAQSADSQANPAALGPTQEQASAVPAEPPPPPPPIKIPAGTVLTVSLQEPLGSKSSETGQPFDASVVVPIVVDEKTVVPKGANATGVVAEAHAAGKFKGGATLNLQLEGITINGKHYPVKTATWTQESKGKGKRSAAMIGGGAGGGAAIGAIAGGGKGAGIGALVGAGLGTAGAAFTGNRDISLPVETQISFTLTSSVKVRQKPPGSSQ
jgi:hypothetical protein